MAVSLFLVTAPPQAPAAPSAERDAVSPERAPADATRPAPRPKRRKPELKLSCFPQISNAIYFEGRMRSRITCTVRVLNPDEQFWCPAVDWSFGIGNTPSSHEGDCDPYEKVVAEEGEPEYWSEDRPKEFGLTPGTYEIWVTLRKSGKVIARESAVVRVN